MTLSPFFMTSLITLQAVSRMVPIECQVNRQMVAIKPIAPFTRTLIAIIASLTRPMTTCSRGDKITDKTLSVPVITFFLRWNSRPAE
ncbi:MAG: hypothetical protein DQL93_0170 (endogenous virus) [Lactobacillus phage ViSo-2018b]|nr:MAG: hypothetical protein DQL93_0170 [Lactobacillus phage ViSo-2018b]